MNVIHKKFLSYFFGVGPGLRFIFVHSMIWSVFESSVFESGLISDFKVTTPSTSASQHALVAPRE